MEKAEGQRKEEDAKSRLKKKLKEEIRNIKRSGSKVSSLAALK